nr:MAG TPA: hypothetical protein [Caudoviricetes sp.]
MVGRAFLHESRKRTDEFYPPKLFFLMLSHLYVCPLFATTITLLMLLLSITEK